MIMESKHVPSNPLETYSEEQLGVLLDKAGDQGNPVRIGRGRFSAKDIADELSRRYPAPLPDQPVKSQEFSAPISQRRKVARRVGIESPIDDSWAMRGIGRPESVRRGDRR